MSILNVPNTIVQEKPTPLEIIHNGDINKNIYVIDDENEIKRNEKTESVPVLGSATFNQWIEMNVGATYKNNDKVIPYLVNNDATIIEECVTFSNENISLTNNVTQNM